jgi:hypothetical protein
LGFNNWFIKALRIWLIYGFFTLIVIKCNVCVFDKEKYKKNVLCVAYGQYPNMFWTLFYVQKILEVLKMCFRMDFLNTKKLFSCIFEFYNMFVKLQRVLANISKNIKILFWGEFIYYSPLIFG